MDISTFQMPVSLPFVGGRTMTQWEIVFSITFLQCCDANQPFPNFNKFASMWWLVPFASINLPNLWSCDASIAQKLLPLMRPAAQICCTIPWHWGMLGVEVLFPTSANWCPCQVMFHGLTFTQFFSTWRRLWVFFVWKHWFGLVKLQAVGSKTLAYEQMSDKKP